MTTDRTEQLEDKDLDLALGAVIDDGIQSDHPAWSATDNRPKGSRPAASAFDPSPGALNLPNG